PPRAVRAGLGMVEALGELNAHLARERGIRLVIRVGIHTGLVVVGEMGDGGGREQLALRDSPNVAARLLGLAAPDTVLISAATHQLSGVLQDINGHYELTGAVSAFAIPATLHDSLMARLDRLVTAKAVAQYAAVIGRQFSYALLQAVSQVDEPTLQRDLDRLVDAELLYQRGLPPQATYLFKHALI